MLLALPVLAAIVFGTIGTSTAFAEDASFGIVPDVPSGPPLN